MRNYKNRNLTWFLMQMRKNELRTLRTLIMNEHRMKAWDVLWTHFEQKEQVLSEFKTAQWEGQQDLNNL
jgi:hypothetical protein